ncbi:MAG: hypothetical protein AAFQ66_16705 [Pseudomonadota bacterium]
MRAVPWMNVANNSQWLTRKLAGIAAPPRGKPRAVPGADDLAQTARNIPLLRPEAARAPKPQAHRLPNLAPAQSPGVAAVPERSCVVRYAAGAFVLAGLSVGALFGSAYLRPAQSVATADFVVQRIAITDQADKSVGFAASGKTTAIMDHLNSVDVRLRLQEALSLSDGLPKIGLDHDPDTGLTTLTVSDPDPETALKASELLIGYAATYVEECMEAWRLEEVASERNIYQMAFSRLNQAQGQMRASRYAMARTTDEDPKPPVATLASTDPVSSFLISWTDDLTSSLEPTPVESLVEFERAKSELDTRRAEFRDAIAQLQEAHEDARNVSWTFSVGLQPVLSSATP